MFRLAWILLPAMAAWAQDLQPLPPSTGTGVIQGVVLDASGHEPLKKAQVMLNGGREPLTAMTDASGRFAFHELPAGTFWLNASKMGYNARNTLFQETGLQVALKSGEEKKDVEVMLVRGASVRGRVVDEDETPLRGCAVMAAQPVYEHGKRILRVADSGNSTSENGHYQISGLAEGDYLLFARCHEQVEAAHPLLPPGDPRVPYEAYRQQFYGGGLDPASATKVTVAAGADVEGIEFQMSRTPAVVLRGMVHGAEGQAAGRVSVMLTPVNNQLRYLLQAGAGVDMASGKFRIGPVAPGSYRLTAFEMSGDHPLWAQRMVEVGSAAQTDPLELWLSSGIELKGSMQYDSDDAPPIEAIRISLQPLDHDYFTPTQPQAETAKDGTFSLTGILPGRWRLMINAAGYVKSLSLAGQAVSPYNFEIAPGSAGPMRIAMGAKTAEVSINVTGASPDQQVSLALYPDDPERLGQGTEQVNVVGGNSQAVFGAIPPGRYHIFAIPGSNAWPVLQRPDLLKALESETESLDVPESGRVSKTVAVIPREDLVRLLTEKQ